MVGETDEDDGCMRFTCLAFDYDGTLAIEGRISEELLSSLAKAKNSGIKLILITGRILKDLHRVFPQNDLFDYVMAENGAVLYCPATRITKLLCDPIPLSFVENLRKKGVKPIEVGNVIVSSWHPNENLIIEAIHEFGLDLHISFNKGAVMVLPAGVNKATGLKAALSELNQSVHNTIGIGDGENDFVFMDKCEYAVAVGNALPVLKDLADLILEKDNGQGVIDFLNHTFQDENFDNTPAMRRQILLGFDDMGTEIKIASHDFKILIAGPSKSGKSTACMSLLNQINTQGYQFCLVDPEGEYDHAPQAVIVGNEHYAPEISDILRLLLNPENNVVVNLLGVPLNERPQFFLQIFSALHEVKRKYGRPHWLVIDEAHHMLHPYWNSMIDPIWQSVGSLALVTVDPAEISKTVLNDIDLVLAVGAKPADTMDSFASKVSIDPIVNVSSALSFGQAEVWFRKKECTSIKLNLIEAPLRHKRHLRKYAEGNLGKQRSFYFTGADGKLKIRCQNLFLFMQIGDGLDDETWLYHLKRGDYSAWVKDSIHDPELAIEIKGIEKSQMSCDACREAVKKMIEKKYSMPARVLG